MNKKAILIGIALLLAAAYAKAEITLIEPQPQTTIKIQSTNLAPHTQAITIKNTGQNLETDIQIKTDLNTTTNPDKINLDAGQQKTIEVTIYPKGNLTAGKITIGSQWFEIRIYKTQIPEKSIADTLLEKEITVGETKTPLASLLVIGAITFAFLTQMAIITKS